MAIRPLCTELSAVNGAQPSGEAGPIRCKRWSCEVCREINRAKVIRLAKEAKPRALLTLTVRHSDYDNPASAAAALKRGLRLLRLRLKRHTKLENFQFLAVFEKHKSGWPHLHLLIRGKFLPWKELRSMWESITGSFMVDIRRIKSDGLAAAYCAKYIGKDLAAFPGCKRWWRSHHYSPAKADDYQDEKANGEWRAWQIRLDDFAEGLSLAGFAVQIGRFDRMQWEPDEGRPPTATVADVLRDYGAVSARMRRRS